MARTQRRFTIYDMMEAKGVFELNPANVDSRDSEGQPLYKGPVEYPKMLYHPLGEEKIIVQPQAVVTPFGPKWIDEQREILHVIVQDKAEEARYRNEGWHDHPAKAIAASGKQAPSMGSSNRIAELEAQIAKLTAEREDQTSLVNIAVAANDKKVQSGKSSANPKLADLPTS